MLLIWVSAACCPVRRWDGAVEVTLAPQGCCEVVAVPQNCCWEHGRVSWSPRSNRSRSIWSAAQAVPAASSSWPTIPTLSPDISTLISWITKIKMPMSGAPMPSTADAPKLKG